MEETEPFGFAPIHLAAYLGFEDTVKYLIEAGCDVNKPNAQGASALHLAAKQNHVSVIDVLVQNHSNLLIKDNNGKTAIEYAPQNSDSFNFIKAALLKLKESRKNSNSPITNQNAKKENSQAPNLKNKSNSNISNQFNSQELSEKVQKALSILQENLKKEKQISDKLRKALNSATLCRSCNIKKKDVLFFPCLHLCVCSSCSLTLISCPSCSLQIDGKVIISL